VIAEIQQNSDTTYRVFDWNRTGLDSKPRALHIEESLQSIDFSDFTPTLTHAVGETLVSCPLFEVERWVLDGPRGAVSDGQFGLFLCLEGSVGVCQLTIHPGELILIPACMPDTELVPSAPGATVLRISIPIG